MEPASRAKSDMTAIALVAVMLHVIATVATVTLKAIESEVHSHESCVSA